MQNSDLDVLSFVLGTLGVYVLTHLLQSIGVSSPDFVATTVCCLMYLYIR